MYIRIHIFQVYDAAKKLAILKLQNLVSLFQGNNWLGLKEFKTFRESPGAGNMNNQLTAFKETLYARYKI